jgi:hypothetical protein
MISGIAPVGKTQNWPFLSCGSVLLGVRFVYFRDYMKRLVKSLGRILSYRAQLDDTCI